MTRQRQFMRRKPQFIGSAGASDLRSFPRAASLTANADTFAAAGGETGERGAPAGGAKSREADFQKVFAKQKTFSLRRRRGSLFEKSSAKAFKRGAVLRQTERLPAPFASISSLYSRCFL